MTISNIAPLESVIVQVEKRLLANPAVTWVNNYTATNNGSSTMAIGSVNLLAERLLEFERLIHLNTVEFVQIRASTWVEEASGYDPEQFVTIPVPGGTVGSRNSSGEVLSLEHALYVRKSVPTGRQGKLFYRGCLGEGDINSPAGDIRLTNPGALQTVIDGAVSSSDLSEHIAWGGSELELTMINGANPFTQTIRLVDALTVAGVTLVNKRRRHYNRTS